MELFESAASESLTPRVSFTEDFSRSTKTSSFYDPIVLDLSDKKQINPYELPTEEAAKYFFLNISTFGLSIYLNDLSHIYWSYTPWFPDKISERSRPLAWNVHKMEIKFTYRNFSIRFCRRSSESNRELALPQSLFTSRNWTLLTPKGHRSPPYHKQTPSIFMNFLVIDRLSESVSKSGRLWSYIVQSAIGFSDY